MSSGAAPAGWYPDPDIIGYHRWWTGGVWSAVVVADAAVPRNSNPPPGGDVAPEYQPSKPPAWNEPSEAASYVAPSIPTVPGGPAYVMPSLPTGPNATTPSTPKLPTAGPLPVGGDAVPELPIFMPPGSVVSETPSIPDQPVSVFGGGPVTLPGQAPPPSGGPIMAPPPSGGPIMAPPPSGGPIMAPPPVGQRLNAPPPSANQRIDSGPMAAPTGQPVRVRMEAGWYNDPLIPNQFRYWDGNEWTNAVSGG